MYSKTSTGNNTEGGLYEEKVKQDEKVGSHCKNSNYWSSHCGSVVNESDWEP